MREKRAELRIHEGRLGSRLECSLVPGIPPTTVPMVPKVFAINERIEIYDSSGREEIIEGYSRI